MAVFCSCFRGLWFSAPTFGFLSCCVVCVELHSRLLPADKRCGRRGAWRLTELRSLHVAAAAAAACRKKLLWTIYDTSITATVFLHASPTFFFFNSCAQTRRHGRSQKRLRSFFGIGVHVCVNARVCMNILKKMCIPDVEIHSVNLEPRETEKQEIKYCLLHSSWLFTRFRCCKNIGLRIQL